METNTMTKKSRKTILIVEDEFINREILKNILVNDYEILEAEDGKIALELLNNNKDIISLVLLDLQLPHISGLELLSYMQSDHELNDILNH